jgi:SHAQKYF class myb-like DNA-binding protein
MKTDKRSEDHSGRWTPQEHALFLTGLEKFGKNWKAIERVVGTRTSTQARSHAQKYFLKADKDKARFSKIVQLKREELRDVGVQYGEDVVFLPTTDMSKLLACMPFTAEPRCPKFTSLC